MGRIQSSIGLITGVPITDTVNQLMQIAARPRNLLVTRNTRLQQQQAAVTELMSLVIALQFTGDQLGNAEIFNKKTVASADKTLLTATATGNPPEGTFQFTPVRQAQTGQLLSTGFASLENPIGEGTLTFRSGGALDEAVRLDELNGAAGVERGKIRITDRSGATAVIDLRFAETIDDVLEAINSNESINVSASTVGDSLRLVDNTGQTASNLRVQEVSSGRTASDLGLSGIDVAVNTATGQDILRGFNQLKLDRLNDGSGVRLRDAVADLEVTFSDGSAALQIDLGTASTLGELVQVINTADPSRLAARLSSDGDRIELEDLTTPEPGESFTVTSTLGGHAAEDLGLDTDAADGVISSRRLLAGLKTSLLSSLGGGSGLDELGELKLTDRSGATATVDLASAETIQDILDLINEAAVDITARVNDARTGIVLVDSSGGTGNLIVENSGATTTADALGIAVDADVTTIDNGSLHLQVISERTLLEDLNGGSGVFQGSFVITDSLGAANAVKLNVDGMDTVGDVINAINALGIGVEARINDTGDGILLEDTAGGPGLLNVREVGSGTAAADLKILGSSVDGVIDGSTAITIEIDEDDTLADLIEKINASGAQVTASSFSTGSGLTPHRLSLVSQQSGKAGDVLVDASGADFTFQQIARAQDALLVFGSSASGSSGVLVTSSSNTFTDVLEGASLTIEGTSDQAVAVTVTPTDTTLGERAKAFVDAYNRLRDRLTALTAFNASTGATAALFGSNEALRLDTDLARLATGRFTGAGGIQSLEAVGISMGEGGRLSLDAEKLHNAFVANPDQVERFFTDEQFGVSAKFHAVIESLAGVDGGLLVARSGALSAKIDSAQKRITFLTSRLDVQRESMLQEFYRMEEAIGKLQSSLSAVQQIQILAPLSLRGSS